MLQGLNYSITLSHSKSDVWHILKRVEKEEKVFGKINIVIITVNITGIASVGDNYLL